MKEKKEKVKPKELNVIKKITKKMKVSSVAISLCIDVHPLTVTGWNTNRHQPSLEDLDLLCDFLELDNHALIVNTERVNTGLAIAVENEFLRLTKDEGIETYAMVPNRKNIEVKAFNPVLKKKILKFIADYKKKNKPKVSKAKEVDTDAIISAKDEMIESQKINIESLTLAIEEKDREIAKLKEEVINKQ